MSKYSNDIPHMKEAGYTFVKYLNEGQSRAIFKIENDDEVWYADDDLMKYGFYFDNKKWRFEKTARRE